MTAKKYFLTDNPPFIEAANAALKEYGDKPLYTMTPTQLAPLFKTWVWETQRAAEPVKAEQERYWTRYDLRDNLNMSLPTIDKRSDEGLFERIRIGGKVLFDPAQVRAALEQMKKE